MIHFILCLVSVSIPFQKDMGNRNRKGIASLTKFSLNILKLESQICDHLQRSKEDFRRGNGANGSLVFEKI